jgi:hypothetical protein
MLIFTVGKDRKDATCGDRDISLPSVLVGATSQNSERLLASGNERTPILWPAEDIKAGYKLRAADQLSLVVDLMNDNMEDKTVYVTVTYDVVDGIKPEWDEVRVVWLDVNQCGTSERSWPKNKSLCPHSLILPGLTCGAQGPSRGSTAGRPTSTATSSAPADTCTTGART